MRIHYVSGSRADFGLMAETLKYLLRRGFEIEVVATGQHLSQAYGNTIEDIESSEIPIAGRIPVKLTGLSGAEMGLALAEELKGFVEFWQKSRPDLVLVLGDRGEMVAGALAAIHLGLHVAHIHGGELSGTLDESFRHAITKLAHYHFVVNEEARDRLVKMGENSDHIWVVGAPGLVDIPVDLGQSQGSLNDQFTLPSEADFYALVIFHPVVQEASEGAYQTAELLKALQLENCSGVVLRPNSDAGGAGIDKVLDAAVNEGWFVICDHLPRQDYLTALSKADIIVGNSSSGIIESASLQTPCLNIGSRQNRRLRNANVFDCPKITLSQLRQSFQSAVKYKGPYINKYGNGDTPIKIFNIISELSLDKKNLSKINSY